MKIAGILLSLFGTLLFLGGAAVEITLALAEPPIRCDPVKHAQQRVEEASRELASATGTLRQAQLQEKLNQEKLLLALANGSCDEAWTGRYVQMGVAGGAAMIGGATFILGVILFFVGRRRARRALA